MHTNIRSSHPKTFCEKGVLKNFAKFTEKHLCQSLFLIKLQGSGLQLYWKRDSGTGVFLWFLLNKNTFLQNTSDGSFLNKSLFGLLLLFLRFSLLTSNIYLFAREDEKDDVKSVRDCFSLLTNCNMSKTFFKCTVRTCLCHKFVFFF